MSSKVMPGHPGEEQLLRFADGELPPRDSAQVRAHLEACWDCRSRLNALEETVADCVHYRKSVLQAHLPPPVKPWRNLSGGFAAIDREISGASSWWRSLWTAVAAPRFWAPAVAAGLVAALVIVPWLQVTETVQAAELLRKAVVAAEAKAHPVSAARKLQVRTKSQKLLRVASAAADLRPVAALFESAKYDWADPLSAKAYLDWNSRQVSKTDEVIPQGDSFYEVRTTSKEGVMTEATLRLRQADLQPVQGTFRFRNDEWVELTEVDAAPETISAVAAPPRHPAAVAPAPAAPVSAADELRVLEALHRIGADLGDPIEIARSNSQVSVKGFAIDSRRRAQIEQALRGVPNVSLQFAEDGAPAGLAAPAAAPGGALAVRSGASPLEPQLANEVFDRFEQIMARAHAIHRLAARFPDASTLGPAEAAAYRAMQRRHAEALVRHERVLGATLNPLALSAALAPAAAVVPATAASLLEAARRLERSVSALLGAASFQGDASQLPETVANQRAALEQVTRSFLESMGQ